MVILGISLGTTTVGIAVMNENELVTYNTHSFRAIWSECKAEAIIARLLEYIIRYRVQVVAIKLPPETHQPVTVTHLFHQLREQCTYHGCMVQTCTKAQLKRSLPGVSNTSDLMRYVAQHHPALVPQYEQSLKRKNQYHKRIFEAVIAAHMYDKKRG